MPLLDTDQLLPPDLADLASPFARWSPDHRAATTHPAYKAARALADAGAHVHVIAAGGTHCVTGACAGAHVHVHTVPATGMRCAAGCKPVPAR
ncbi:hypothetical protein [Streptomyces goshikiensis]